MMTSSGGNILRVTGLYDGNPAVTFTKASDTELWCFLWCSFEQAVEQTVQMPVIWDAMALIATFLLCGYAKV